MINKNVKNFPFYIIVILFISLLYSCNDKPSDLAVNLLPDTVEVKSISTYDTLLITGRTVHQQNLPIFNTGSVFIGKHDDVSAIYMVVYGLIPDTLGTLREDQIQSTELVLRPNRYAYGDTNGGSFGFDIYKVSRKWTPITTTYDSVMVSPADYYSEKIGSWEGNIALKDSMDPISIMLPSDLIIEWLKSEMVLDSATNTMKPQKIPDWGLAFIPKNNSNVIYSFEASAPQKVLQSTIDVKYKLDGNDSLYNLHLIPGIDVSFLSTNIPDTSQIVIQNGLNYWTKLDFDLSMIPKFSGIHKVQLELTLDESKSRKGNRPLDTLIEISYFENETKSIIFNFLGKRQENSNKYIFPSLTSIVQFKNRMNGKFSLELLPYTLQNMSRELERLTFFGFDNEDPDKRPILKVIYSLNPAYLEQNK